MKNCSSCGKELADNAKFCPGCGSKQEAHVEQSSSHVSNLPSASTNKNTLIFAGFGVVICLLIAFLFSKKQTTDHVAQNATVEIPLVAGPIKIPKGYSYLCNGPRNGPDILSVEISNSPTDPSLLYVVYKTQSKGMLPNGNWKFISNQSQDAFQFNYLLASENDHLYIRPAQNTAYLGYVVNGEDRYDLYEACRLVKNQ